MWLGRSRLSGRGGIERLGATGIFDGQLGTNNHGCQGTDFEDHSEDGGGDIRLKIIFNITYFHAHEYPKLFLDLRRYDLSRVVKTICPDDA